jgi:hypothetical protein
MSPNKQYARSSDLLLLQLLKEPQPSEPLILDFSRSENHNQTETTPGFRKSLEAIYQDLKISTMAHVYFLEQPLKQHEHGSEKNHLSVVKPTVISTFNKPSSSKFIYILIVLLIK